MGINLSALRGYVDGTLDESAIEELNSAAQGYDLDGEELTDVEMQEAAALGMPIILQGEIMGDQCEALEEATIEAYQKLESYLVGQGYLSEAAAVPTNPKVTVVRMSKDATLRRLKTMYTLYLARRNDDKAFKKYKILPEKCKGCTKCSRLCPVGALSGEVKGVHVIDSSKCIKCGACIQSCRFEAIVTA